MKINLDESGAMAIL